MEDLLRAAATAIGVSFYSYLFWLAERRRAQDPRTDAEIAHEKRERAFLLGRQLSRRLRNLGTKRRRDPVLIDNRTGEALSDGKSLRHPR